MDFIRARVQYGDYSFEMSFATLSEYYGACKLVEKLREEDYIDLYINDANSRQREIDEIDAKIAELKEKRNKLTNN